jgi:hypothetical protein
MHRAAIQAILALEVLIYHSASGLSEEPAHNLVPNISAYHQPVQVRSVAGSRSQGDRAMSETNTAQAQQEEEDWEGIDPNDELFATKPIKPRRMYAYDW